MTVVAVGASPAWAQPLDLPAAAPAKDDTAAAPAAIGSTASPEEAATVSLNNRRIVSFRATLLGDSPAERAAMAREALKAAVAQGSAGVVTRTAAGEAVRFELDGTTLFFLVPDDVPGPRPVAMLDAAAQKTEARLRMAVQEAREATDPRRLALGAAWAAGASVLAFLLWRLLFALRRRVVARLDSQLERWQRDHPGKSVVNTYADHAQTAARSTATALTWGLALLLADVWVTFVLRQFAYTRPWGERSTAWLLDVLQQFALAAAGAVPGLLTAALIFVIARLITRTNSLFMRRVERGDVHVGWLDRDTAGPTRRLGNFVIWLFALALAYPFLPGASSEAFKGVSVLAGLMLSLGASGVVGQVVSGLSLMYSRTLRVGEYVKIGDVEGTVTLVGMFATKVHTGLGEEVSLPNAVVFSQSVRNFSRLVQDGQFVLHTPLTIGYGTPWRQVHAMLLEAARRTPGVAQEPPPYVMQTALSDFYVEYRLCAQADRGAPRRRAEAMNQLHGNIQDVFNEHGVQIMSPHYRSDPLEPQVVPPAKWFTPPAKAQPADPAPPA
ncbi:mechanosensitive ion channel family protein [Ideonella sp. A 288]|uniref:mechanosensitive ion channel family protein n=1 Tax=Ideonella sp. A 288 TaxID=1962181 RepID=UPI001303D901|nr:mechanosensitive ion channel domain-containing protein [Ideonella sp. A 288]